MGGICPCEKADGEERLWAEERIWAMEWVRGWRINRVNIIVVGHKNQLNFVKMKVSQSEKLEGEGRITEYSRLEYLDDYSLTGPGHGGTGKGWPGPFLLALAQPKIRPRSVPPVPSFSPTAGPLPEAVRPGKAQ